MKRKWKQILCGTLVGLLVATAAPAAFAGNGYVTEVEAASKKAKPKLNKTKISVKTGKTYTLKVNGEVKGQIPYSKTAKNYTINDINIDGNVVIELVDNATSNRVSFDNLSWTCYTKMAVSEQMSKNNRLTVYPNPVKNGELFISGIRNNEAVQIYNANGQLVQTVNATANEKINVRKLSKGVYFVKTKTGSSKIIVD